MTGGKIDLKEFQLCRSLFELLPYSLIFIPESHKIKIFTAFTLGAHEVIYVERGRPDCQTNARKQILQIH